MWISTILAQYIARRRRPSEKCPTNTLYYLFFLLPQKNCERNKKYIGKKSLSPKHGARAQANWSSINRVIGTAISFLIWADFKNFQSNCPATSSYDLQSNETSVSCNVLESSKHGIDMKLPSETDR